MSYRELDVWKLARQVAVSIHQMTLRDLPKFEMYETASQIRRSSKSTRANIVEGYGRRRYKGEFLRFLSYSIASNDETTDHLECLFETDSLSNADLYRKLHDDLDELGRKLNRFIKSVEARHRT